MEQTPGQKRKERKKRYKEKLEKYLGEYKNILMVNVDNVGSYQMQKIRIALRGKAAMIMGKNTLMRMIIREQMKSQPQLESLLEFIRGNIGFVFTNGDLKELRDMIVVNKVPAAAKSGTFAPIDVFVPPGPTGLDPGQTSFFQALNIGTKIVRGSIEISTQVHLIKAGDKVTSSAVALLSKLDIKPFFYGVLVQNVYENGSIYPARILDITRDEIVSKFLGGVRRMAAISLAVGYSNPTTVPHSIVNGFKKLLAISLATNYSFKMLETLQSASKASQEEKKEEKPKGKEKEKENAKDAGKNKKAEKVEEAPPEEEDDGLGGGFGLFGGED